MRIAVIDDLVLCRNEVKVFLSRFMSEYYAGESYVVEEYETGSAFLEEFEAQAFDLIFIDQYMKGLSGMETAVKIRAEDDLTAIIFVTTSRDHAVDSYGVRASGYLVKPFHYEDFARSMKLAGVEKLRSGRFIQVSGDKIKILLSEILWCDQDEHYVQIHTDRRGMIRYRAPFSKLEEQLSQYPQFLSCYRGCLVNMDRARCIDGLLFVMDTGARVPFRKRRHGDIEKQYKQYLFRLLREDQLL